MGKSLDLGKIARALANSLSLAAKADAFTKRDLTAELKKRFDGRYEEIMAEYERVKSKPVPAQPVQSALGQ